MREQIMYDKETEDFLKRSNRVNDIMTVVVLVGFPLMTGLCLWLQGVI